MVQRAIVLVVLLAASAFPVRSTAVPPEAAADAVAAGVLGANPQAGLTIAVARSGVGTFARGYGESDVRRHIRATAETVYPICSISKNFAASAILKLAQEGKVDLDAPVALYFAQDPLPGRRVTVRQLLNHTSGAGSYNDGPDWEAIKARPIPAAEMLARIAGADHGEPGVGWAYSNSAYYLAGLLVERVSGTGYWDYLEAAFFRPLGMRHSRPCTAVALSDRAHGYRAAGGRLEDAEAESWANPFAGGGVCSTAGDLLIWQAALDEGRALAPASVRLMRTPTSVRGGPALDYGLGTRLGELDGHAVLGHTGGGQGFSTVLLRLPEDGLTVVVLRNLAAPPGAPIIAARLARRLLGLPAFAPKDLPVSAELLKAIAGDWTGDDGPFRLAARGDRLEVEVGGGGPKLPSPYQGASTFVIGEEELARFVVVDGRSDWELNYGGGLFESAGHRQGP